jgi:hypothetical protein
VEKIPFAKESRSDDISQCLRRRRDFVLQMNNTIESKNGWNFQQKYTIFSRRAAAEQNRRKIVIWDLGFF